MEDHHHHVDATRPSLGFPLGTALLLIIVFFLSGIFSCCYHWEKLRSLRRRSTDLESATATSSSSRGSNSSTTYDDQIIHTKPTSVHPGSKQEKRSESLPVIMPGDEAPRFIALPCPCEPAIGVAAAAAGAIIETPSTNLMTPSSSSLSSSSSASSSSYSNLLVYNYRIASFGV